MKNKIHFLVLLVLTITSIVNCRKKETIATPTTITPVNDATTVNASVRGTVVNENNVPITDATVTLGSFTTTTNTYGVFEFVNKSISENNTHVKVVKTGYFNGNRSMKINANQMHQVRIKMQPKTIAGSISATAGGTITMTNGAKITFPANSIVDAAGNAYTGTVNVAMAYIDPLANDLSSILQGDLRGIGTNNAEQVLETYGMIGAELETTTAQPLKIASGKKASLTNPIQSSLLSNAPATIPLWHFDETKGRWVEEGSATKVGSNYVGDVAHFSFWNFDVPIPFINLCVNAKNNLNEPLNNTVIRIRRMGINAISSTATTNNLGVICGNVPKNEALIAEVLDLCGNVIHSQSIGPYSSNASVNITATIPPANNITFTGIIVDCSNNPIANGSAFIITNNGYNYIVTTASNGSFSLSIPFCSGTSTNYSVFGIDNNLQQQGIAKSGVANVGTNSLGNIVACGSNSAEFVNLVIDGVPYSWSKPSNGIIGGVFSAASFVAAPYATGYQVTAYEGLAGSSTIGNVWITSFKHNYVPGTYPFINIIPQGYCQIQIRTLTNVMIMYSDRIDSPSPVLNLTEVGPATTGFFAGNYNVTMLFQPGNITKNVSCNFRFRRP
jgi:hypothetical protein